MIRTFVAAEIPAFQKVDALLDYLRSSGARLSIPKSHGLHITLKFLGDIKEDSVNEILDILRRIAVNFAPFEARIARVGGFPGLRNPRVLWIGVEDDGKLGEIAKVINMELSSVGFEPESRAFRSHITIARVKSKSNIDKAIGIMREYESAEFGVFRMERIKLKKSTLTPTGAIYEDLGIIPLSKPTEGDG